MILAPLTSAAAVLLRCSATTSWSMIFTCTRRNMNAAPERAELDLHSFRCRIIGHEIKQGSSSGSPHGRVRV